MLEHFLWIQSPFLSVADQSRYGFDRRVGQGIARQQESVFDVILSAETSSSPRNVI